MLRRVCPAHFPKALNNPCLIAFATLSTTAMLLLILTSDSPLLPPPAVLPLQHEHRPHFSPPPPPSPPQPAPEAPSPPHLPSPGIPEATSDDAAEQKPRKQPRPTVFLKADEALAYAKREIENAPPLAPDDPDLQPPLFRNVSVFKRSYELMEEMLKVYVYQDGSRPIFHTPPIKGIYASEGWFMKLLEKNKQFLTKNGKKAHLFYLPYSVHRLVQTLYTPDSPNMHQLSVFVRNYVNMVSSKYPFWNRTRGTDHFFVACHDWVWCLGEGPYTTKEHGELMKNSIKALCNADVSEGIFVQGRDVSLPETSIRLPRRPLGDMGGIPISQRTILAFFAGYMHGRVRPILLKHWKDKDSDMRIYGPLPSSVASKMSYAQHMKSSKFCICPMGYEVNSPRIVEAIYYECIPVIIADNFVLPFDQVFDWTSFSVVVAEKDIPDLKNILLKISPLQYLSMHTNLLKLQKHFLWHAKPVRYDLFHMTLHSIWFSRVQSVALKE